MGIKDLNKLIKRYAPDAMFTMPINDLAGKKIAIDGNGWLYANLATVRKKVINKTDVTVQEPDPIEIRKELLNALINFIINWLVNGITPIFIFDGREVPIEKLETREDRQEKRVTARAKIDALYEKLKGDPLLNNGKIVEDLRKELRNYLQVTNDDFESMKTLLINVGIPCLQAKGEAEKLCSAFCVEEEIAAVWSVDTDNLAFGCPLLITGHSSTYTYDEYNNRVLNLDCVRIDKVLEGLKIDYRTFVDLCIMCGCDFNTNIPKYAALKSYNLLLKHGSIDNLPENLDISCLRHQRCREIFSFTPSKYLIQDQNEGLILEINKNAIKTCRDYMDVVGMSIHINKFVAIYQTILPCTAGLVEKLHLLNVVTIKAKEIKEVIVTKRLILNIIPK